MRLHKDAKAELIRSLPLFGDCTPTEVAEVAAIADEIDLSAGRKLTTQDADGQEFVVIVDGEADVIKGDEVINTLGAGDFFGEIALLTGGPRTATVTARTSVHALVIEGHAFRRLLEDAPDIREKVERALADRSQ
ncbi:cyclic nucleotide-binding domain-containing protein [Nocardioides marmorisolisilvae]|uniref:Cyclic nucleotide-binding domain-containing protein n=1 Tax=Nocardioides marmorisolisilvae TaxID=1542737 RepID=A0A3N0DX23_9ACTN|nr:cyclic nucleotide-binding domain-containing protein [Nocardioides marmorisolisilvae]RNL80145.1 cyclic nucleotide-binding domain-containing protein [Nocardioides marmorisolisilvae]